MEAEMIERRADVKWPCVSLIGMAGAGKTTVGSALAATTGWALMDTDNMLEATYACRLQTITDAMSKEAFLDIEERMILDLNPARTIVATGGSVVYRERAVEKLRSLGPVVYLRAPLDDILARIALNPERGLAVAPGETVADLYRQRAPLYERAADLICETANRSPVECANFIREKLGDAFAGEALASLD